MSDPKVTAAHLRRAAAVYCRQSTLIQVERNRESTLRQYELDFRDQAAAWAQARWTARISSGVGWRGTPG